MARDDEAVEASDEEESLISSVEIGDISIEGSSWDHEIRVSSSIIIQKYIRRFNQRCRVHRVVESRYEKIYDPKRRRYYYYDMINDLSSWQKPRLLLHSDLFHIAPTYTPDQAAIIIQRKLWQRLALKKVRMLYQNTVISAIDDNSGQRYYYNPKSGRSSWHLPQFMKNRLDYNYDGSLAPLDEPLNKQRRRKKNAGTEGGDDGEEDEFEGEEDSEGKAADGKESDDDSNLSEDSEIIRERRRQARLYPRSKAQNRVDMAEDDQRVTDLNLSGFGAARFTSRIYDLTSLQKLDLSNNSLRKMHSELQYLHNLEFLNISRNKIASIPKEIEELTKLRVFRASDNLLETYPGHFYKLTALEELDFSHNPIQVLPIEIGNLELLKETNVWDVGIGMLSNLTSLRLSGCKFSEWILQLDRLKKLSHLDLSNNKIHTIPGPNLRENSRLMYLDLSGNLFKTLPVELYQLHMLQVLNISHNQLTEFPPCEDIIGMRMGDLQEIDISFNYFSSLDKRIAIFHRLHTLRASNNIISSIDNAILTLSAVQFIDLSHNHLDSLPQGFASCKSIAQLNLSYNHFALLPVPLANLKDLTDLDLSHNSIETTPTSMSKVFSGMKSLKTLDISYNLLTRLPRTFYLMKSLVKLNISHNHLAEFSRYFGELTALETLDASYNELTSLPNSISTAKSLTFADFDRNNISILPAGIVALRKLRFLGLRYNDLKVFPTQLLFLPEVRHLDLSWNARLQHNAIDWKKIDSTLDLKRDLVPTATIKRLLLQAWESFDNACVGKLISFDAEVDGKGFKMPWKDILKSFIVEPETTAENATNSPKKMAHKAVKRGKKGRKSSAAFATEARFIKQTIEQINEWNTRLRLHFKSHCPAIHSRIGTANSGTDASDRDILRGELFVAAAAAIDTPQSIGASSLSRPNKAANEFESVAKSAGKETLSRELLHTVGNLGNHFNQSPQTESPSRPSSSGLDGATKLEDELAMMGIKAKDFQAFSMKLASLFHALNLGHIEDFADFEVPMPDVSVVESLDLGLGFQQSITMFEYIANELYVIATNRRISNMIQKLKASGYGSGRRPPTDKQTDSTSRADFAEVHIKDNDEFSREHRSASQLSSRQHSHATTEPEEDPVLSPPRRASIQDTKASGTQQSGDLSTITNMEEARSLNDKQIELVVDKTVARLMPKNGHSSHISSLQNTPSGSRSPSPSKSNSDPLRYSIALQQSEAHSFSRDDDAVIADATIEHHDEIDGNNHANFSGEGAVTKSSDDDLQIENNHNEDNDDESLLGLDERLARKNKIHSRMSTKARRLSRSIGDSSSAEARKGSTSSPVQEVQKSSVGSRTESLLRKNSLKANPDNSMVKKVSLMGLALGYDLGDKESTTVIPLNVDPPELHAEAPRVEKTKILDFVKMPHLLHSSNFAISADSPTLDRPFFRLTLDCYLGLSSALMKRADKLIAAIRDIERRAKIPMSSVNITQRIGEDLLDLSGDLFDLSSLQDADRAKKGLKLREKRRTKKGRVEDILKSANKILQPIDPVGDGLSEKEPSSGNSGQEAGNGEGGGSVEAVNVPSEPDDKANAGSSRLQTAVQPKPDGSSQASLQPQADQQAATDDAIKAAAAAVAVAQAAEVTVKRQRLLRKTLDFLWDQRRLLLVWAAAAVDTADDLLKFCGWDPQSIAFKKTGFVRIGEKIIHCKVGEDYGNSPEMDEERLKDPLGFYSRHAMKVFDAISVEDWAQDLRQCATRLGYLRGRIFTGLNMFFRAQHEFRGVLALSRGFPAATLELAKAFLAQGEFLEARNVLWGLVRKEIPSTKDLDDINPIEVLKRKRELGMLLVLADSTVQLLKSNHNVGNANQRRMFTVSDNGLLLRPVSHGEVDVIHGRTIRHLTLKKEREAKEKVRAAREELEASTDTLRLRARNIAKRCQALVEECKDSIEDTHEVMKLIPVPTEEERMLLRSREKDLIAEKKKKSKELKEPNAMSFEPDSP